MKLLIGYCKKFPLEMGWGRWARVRTQLGVTVSVRLRAMGGGGLNSSHFGAYVQIQ